MIKKSRALIREDEFNRYFDFIVEGSKIINLKDELIMLFKKESSSLYNIQDLTLLDFKFVINSVMQGDFPTIELKLNFSKNHINIESLSHLVSINNDEDIVKMDSFLSKKDLKFCLYDNLNKVFLSFIIRKDLYNEFINELANFKN
jgi:hypothetical protein